MTMSVSSSFYVVLNHCCTPLCRSVSICEQPACTFYLELIVDESYIKLKHSFDIVCCIKVDISIIEIM